MGPNVLIQRWPQILMPIQLALFNIVGKLQKGHDLGGYLYVRCENECHAVNKVLFCGTHGLRKTGMPCFAANTRTWKRYVLKSICFSNFYHLKFYFVK